MKKWCRYFCAWEPVLGCRTRPKNAALSSGLKIYHSIGRSYLQGSEASQIHITVVLIIEYLMAGSHIGGINVTDHQLWMGRRRASSALKKLLWSVYWHWHDKGIMKGQSPINVCFCCKDGHFNRFALFCSQHLVVSHRTAPKPSSCSDSSWMCRCWRLDTTNDRQV